MPKSVYIHIPFCKSKCKYCSFVSFNKLELIDAYVVTLIQEIKDNYCGEKIDTLYFGGGTPSLLQINLIKKILEKFNLSNDCEITFELNPDDAEYNYLRQLRLLGINRLSVGSQTFDDKILHLIGRRHNSMDIVNTIKSAKYAGFENVSADLIYGLPFQNIMGLKYDLEKLNELELQHISTYGLKIEQESLWGKNLPAQLPDDDTQADMYEYIIKSLEMQDFHQYEISNFAKLGFESKHNLTYWNNHEYYGFGVSAHGYVNGVRYSNKKILEEYLRSTNYKESEHIMSLQEKLEEEIFLGLRKTVGIDVQMINKNYNINFETKYASVLKKYKEFFVKTPNRYALNTKGILISNIILSEFLE